MYSSLKMIRSSKQKDRKKSETKKAFTHPSFTSAAAPAWGVDDNLSTRDGLRTNGNESPLSSSWSVSTWLHGFDSVALGSFILILYTITLFPTIPGGDSGELVAESCHLGISHPPGYPLYNMLNYFITNIPVPGKTRAWNANFFSAFLDMWCALFIYWSTLLLTKDTMYHSRIAAATASIAFAFSPLTWTYAVGAEVFAMNNFFAAALLYDLLLYATYKEWKYAYLGAFLCGLGLCNQHTLILFDIPIVLWVLWTQRQIMSIKSFFSMGGFFLLGLLPYIYMPIASYLNPQHGSWGHVTTLEGFLHHFIRADYGTFRLYSSDETTEGLTERLIAYANDLNWREGLYVAVPFACLGMLISTRISFSSPFFAGAPKKGKIQKRLDLQEINTSTVSLLICLMYAFYLVVFHSLSNLPLNVPLLYGVHMRFWQQPNVIAFMWAGIGVSACFAFVQAFILKRWNLLDRIFRTVVAISAVSLQISTWWHLCDQQNGWYIRNYGKTLIETVPAGALYICNYDHQWTSMRYLQRCEGLRPDVTVINLSMMTFNWFTHKRGLYSNVTFPGTHLVRHGYQKGKAFSTKQFLDANYRRFKKSGIYLGGKLTFNDDADFKEAYELVPLGMVERFVKKAQPLDFDEWYHTNQKARAVAQYHLPVLPPEDVYGDDTWEWTIARDYYMHQELYANYLLQQTLARNTSLVLLAEASRLLEGILSDEPKDFIQDKVYKNLGLAYAHMARTSEEFPNEDPHQLAPGIGRANKKLKSRAIDRLIEVWTEWLHKPSAKQDDAYETIKGILESITHTQITTN